MALPADFDVWLLYANGLPLMPVLEHNFAAWKNIISKKIEKKIIRHLFFAGKHYSIFLKIRKVSGFQGESLEMLEYVLKRPRNVS